MSDSMINVFDATGVITPQEEVHGEREDERPRGFTAVLLYVLVPLMTVAFIDAALNGHATHPRVVVGAFVGVLVTGGVVFKLLTSWRR
ncbi:hypothetical protein J1G42_00430 [Cellulomonas sp. zg-ZUI222]|uniref:Uncharacterized protein n=1 Tax=Cellulomonas wangleii TaxID=2816956 RepID=A0ABX8D6T4_9CELL|nr:hypothetical protein [Cellulomonas wangleii]MBO0919292.1 hypothetical protein [Cellulomonas wangleii]MBO0924562.1 hypothetical protein [Cellulomonas wangleii]QVI62545.1 hypothetical protein KG103_00885 [Cellulomonas wangleii]